MKVKIRTESFDPECPTADEIEAMEDHLYADIPKEERSQYSKYEKKWLENHPTIDKISAAFPDSNQFVPVGINSNTAFAINAKEGYVATLIQSEKLQFHKAWKANLLRSRSKQQYEYRLKKFIVGDPNLKEVVEKIYRDTDLIDFKNSLPNDLSEEEIELKYEERQDSGVQTISYTDPVKPNIEESGDFYNLYYNNYNTKGIWKSSKITCKSKHVPAVSICERFILFAYYLTDSIVIVKLFDMEYKQKFEWCCEKEGPLKCAVNSNGWMLISDGITVHQKRDGITYQYMIENQVVTSIHIAEEDNFVFMGTYNGQIYDVNPARIRSYSKTLDIVPILSISTSGNNILGLTITTIITSDAKQFNAVRPLTMKVKGTFVIFLTKYGRIKIGSRIHDNQFIEYKAPEGKTVDVNKVNPWYDNGIYFDGKKLAVLYPDGTIVKKEYK